MHTGCHSPPPFLFPHINEETMGGCGWVSPWSASPFLHKTMAGWALGVMPNLQYWLAKHKFPHPAVSAQQQLQINEEWMWRKINFKKLNRPTGLDKGRWLCVLRVASLPYYESFGLAFEAGLCKSHSHCSEGLSGNRPWWPLCSSDGLQGTQCENTIRWSHQCWVATWFCWQIIYFWF